MRKQIVQWVCALCIAAAAVNALCGIYYKPAGWIDRSQAATQSIWRPRAKILNAMEGFGVYTADGRGYLNADLPLAQEYALAIGSSHTQGKEVQAGNRYSDLLNEWWGASLEELYVYNVSQDGFFLPSIVKHFSAVLQEFPDPKAVLIEIGGTDYPAEAWKDALEQVAFHPQSTGENIAESLSSMQKWKFRIKENLPLLSKSRCRCFNSQRRASSLKRMTCQPIRRRWLLLLR